jgi:hypothetical protein
MSMSPLKPAQSGKVEAADADPRRRPGVPMEHAPKPAGNSHWVSPPKQVENTEILKEPSRRAMSATFGSANPPKGLSGVIRRAAYRIPDYEAKRWLMLIFADRVDVLESDLARAVRRPEAWVIAAALGVGGAMLVARARRRRSFFGRLLDDMGVRVST